MKILENFFAIDGPNGVGKSAVIEQLKQQLGSSELTSVFTREPTDSLLGSFIRQNQNVFFGNTLAALVAANRYEHIENLIVPEVRSGSIVITDRYIASSFVYQMLDGLEYSFIMNLNSEVVLPCHYFILSASSQAIIQRLASRKGLTRFETIDLLCQEAELFKKAGKLLAEIGVKVHLLKNEDISSADTAKAISRLILQNKVNPKPII